MAGAYVSLYIRRTFSVPDLSRVPRLVLQIDYDDSFVAYLNGVEVARANVTGEPPTYNTRARFGHEASLGDASPQPVGVFDLSRFTHLLKPGNNVLAVQGHNKEFAGSSDFSVIPSLFGGEAPAPPAPPALPIGPDATWRYLKGTQEPPSNWAAIGFDSSTWLEGPSGFGYGDGDDSTLLDDMEGRYVSVYFRRAFTVPDQLRIRRLVLSVDYDDAFVAYLNGVEVARANVNGTPPRYNVQAARDHEASSGDNSPQPVEQFDISWAIGWLVQGTNVLAVQGHNIDPDVSSDFSFIVSLAAAEISPADVSFHIAPGDVWSYFNGAAEPPPGWAAPGFDDSAWLAGRSGFGYGDGDDATILAGMQGNYLTVYARRAFTVDAPDAVNRMFLSMDYDDGFVAYLNGVEIARVAVSGDPPPHDAPATASHGASRDTLGPQPVAIVDISAFIHLLVPGVNVLAVQGHNTSLTDPDFSLIPGLLGARASPD